MFRWYSTRQKSLSQSYSDRFFPDRDDEVLILCGIIIIGTYWITSCIFMSECLSAGTRESLDKESTIPSDWWLKRPELRCASLSRMKQFGLRQMCPHLWETDFFSPSLHAHRQRENGLLMMSCKSNQSPEGRVLFLFAQFWLCSTEKGCRRLQLKCTFRVLWSKMVVYIW